MTQATKKIDMYTPTEIAIKWLFFWCEHNVSYQTKEKKNRHNRFSTCKYGQLSNNALIVIS